MKALFFVLSIICTAGLMAQIDTKPTFELQQIHNEPFWPSPTKMPCDNAASPISIVSCNGEDSSDGDNNPVNGAFMTWLATDANNFYYSRIYNGLDTFQIVRTGTSFTVYSPSEPDGISYMATLAIGGNSSNQCLQPGTWTVQVWDVLDDDGDLLPDRDGNGNIIGCFVECSFDFYPSCPPNDDTRFNVDVEAVGCNGDGSITLTNFTSPSLYCVESNGGGATFSWTGPNGFTSSSRVITGLEPGTYTVEVADFYGCISRWTGDVNSLPPLTIDCSALTTPPTTVGGSDGMADINITSGTGDYSISWTGPIGGSINNAVDGINNITGLRPGTYTFTVTDDESGCTEMCTIVVEEPPCEIDFTVTLDADRNIVITVLGGIPNFNLAYVGPTASPPYGSFGYEGIVVPAADLEPGDYEFVLIEEDRFGCMLSVFFTIDPIDCSDLQFSVVDLRSPECGGTDDGLIDIFYEGDFSPDLVWDGPGVTGIHSPRIPDLGPGTYSFVLTDSRGCMRDSSFTLTAPPELFFDCGAVDETLATLNNGKIGYRVTGGVGPFSLSYVATDPAGNSLPGGAPRPIAIQDTLRDLEAGTYVITVTDMNGCTNECTAVVSEPNCSLAPACTVTNPVTAGGTGSVMLDFDGNPNWDVTITGAKDTSFVTGANMTTLGNLPQGDYTLSVFNSDGCVGSCDFSVMGPMCALSFTGMVGNPSCNGSTDGTITLSIENAAPGLMIDWSDDAYDGMTVLSGLGAGSYSVTVTDQTGCAVAPQNFTLTNPAPLTVELSMTESILCHGDSTAAISVSVTGSTGVLSYEWSVDSLPDAQLATGLVAGSYHVLVTDENGCTGRDTIEIVQPDLLGLSCSASGETAAGATDGTIMLSNAGGDAGAGGVVRLSGDLGDHLLTAGTDTTFTGLAPGTYTFTITDANDCTASCSAIVSQGGCEIAVNIMPTQPDCDDATGSATANVTDANGTVDYRWSNGAMTQSVTNLTPGEYAVTVTDALGCDARADVTILPFTDFPVFENPMLSSVCDDACTTLSYSITGTAPFEFQVQVERNGNVFGITTFTSSAEGAGTSVFCSSDFGYPNLEGFAVTIIDVTDANGCSRNVGTELDADVFPQAISFLDTTICSGEPLNFFGEVFDASRTTGDVVVPTPSVNGCDSTVRVNLTFFAPATSVLDTTICTGEPLNFFGEIFDASRTTGDVVVPTPSVNGCDSTVRVNLRFFAPAFSALDTTICAGEPLNFFGEVFDASRTTGDVVVPTPSANGCDSTVRVNLTFFAPAFSALDTTICTGEPLNFFGEVFDASRTTGDVVVPTPSVNGCDSTVRVNLTFFAPAFSALDTTICTGEPLNFFGEVFDASRTTGDVVVPTPSVNGCDSTVRVNLSFYPEVVGVLDTAICAGDTFRYAGQVFVAAVMDELVTLPGLASSGCDSLVSVSVAVIESSELIISGNSVICAGENLNFTIENTGDLPVEVVLSTSPETQILPPNSITPYTLSVVAGTVVDIISADNGTFCPPEVSGAFVVSESDLSVSIDVLSGDGVFGVNCAGDDDGELLAVASGGQAPYDYQWNTGVDGARLSGVPAGRYTVMVTGGSGCTAEALMVLEEPDALVAAIAEVPADCRDTLPRLIVRDVQGGAGPYLYRTQEGAPFVPVTNLPDTLIAAIGRNNFALEDANGCRLDQTFDLAGPPETELVISPARAVIRQGDSIELRLWTDLDVAGFVVSPGPETGVTGNSLFVAPTETTTYFFSIADSSGCAASAQAQVLIDDFVPVYSPNAFSPNGDGTNDVFRIYAAPAVESFSSFSVFNRWGQQVYTQASAGAGVNEEWGWDGRNADGKAHQPAVYIYSVDVNLRDGRVITVKGDFVLMR
ncbi:hypothetical protein FUA23_07665 [Neolewinella aurantiaca]|uniref:T9SS type B sorting domain-containing protein n=1 Tax=Neolewinella aurantiaca TaxID=2602767 RepID=A0A5C7FFZ3_9BACT|nr:gliding motility-associated C-terminal domain-containing protein [Neolewinella aurantiaca]TXF90109.1 hypothetical protein FUA23_07665 [Neolewinella aurantiaca]